MMSLSFQKRSFKTIKGILAAGCIFVVSSFAEQSTDTAGPGAGRFDFSGYAALEVGQLQFAHYAFVSSGEIDHNWIGSSYFNFAVRRTINEHLSVLASIEARLGYDTKPLDQALDPTTFPSSQNIYITLPNAEGIFTFGRKEDPCLTIGIGRFEYKYNQQAQNLGEYLFRTGTYPAYIRTSFDLPLARLTGIVASWKPVDFLRQDFLLTTLTDIQPFTDFTLTSITDVSIGRGLSLGAGVQFANLISTMPNQTSKKNYFSNGYLKAPGDTGYYTFRGTKLLARIMVDPKQYVQADFLGKEDCKLYAEAAVLGLESYPASNTVDNFNLSNTIGYDHLDQKIPAMFGFNWPTHPYLTYGLVPLAITMQGYKAFKTDWRGVGVLASVIAGSGTLFLEKYLKKNLRLDVLAVEAEWYGCKYPDSYYNVTLGDFSTPARPNSGTGYTWGDYTRDDWKWSIYAKKTFYDRFSLIFQASRDHLRLRTLIVKFEDYEEALIRSNQWYWMGKIKINF
jgi:hypothetical protein